MPEIHKKYIQSADGKSIYYETCTVSTVAPVVVLIHGIGGDVDGWHYVRDSLLESGISTVALDVRGHGYSAHPKRAADYTMDLIARDIVHVIDAEHLDQVILVGHSGGAIIALNFALRYQERLRGLVLLAGSHRAPAYMQSRLMKRVANALVSLGALISPPQMAPWHSTYPAGKHHKEYEAYGMIRTIVRNSLRSYLYVGRELMNIDLEHRLAEIYIPTLIVVGEKDSIYPVALSRTMHEKISGARLEIIEGANHVLILNNIEETAQQVIGFVREVHVGVVQ